MNSTTQPVTGETTPPLEHIRTWQRQLITGVLRALLVAGAISLIISSYNTALEGNWNLVAYYTAAYIIVAIITFWRRVSYTLQVAFLLAVIYALGIIGLREAGLSGDGRVFLLAAPVVATLFLGQRMGLFTLLISTLTLLVFSWLFCSGRLSIPVAHQANTADPSAWASGTVVFFMLGLLLTISSQHLIPRLSAALSQSHQLARQLEANQASLEKQVEERTADLLRRNVQLETAAQIAREATRIQDIQQMLSETTRLISQRFGFYHTGIYLLDTDKQYAVLRAASSEEGQRLISEGHRLKVGEEGIIGQVTAHGKPRIAQDVEADIDFRSHPYPVETHSEAVLPLQVRGEIIGALDVQSAQPNAFDETDITVLQILADQIAVAIANAKLLQQVQEALESERRAYTELSQEAWRRLMRTYSQLKATYDPYGLLTTDGDAQETENAKADEGVSPGAAQPQPLPSALEMPIQVRGQTIGVLDARKPPDSGPWSQDEIALLTTLTDQLGVALESARLYQDTQRRAIREHLISAIVSRVLQTMDLETVLRTAAQETRQALGLPEVTVRLAPQPTTVPVQTSSRQPRADDVHQPATPDGSEDNGSENIQEIVPARAIQSNGQDVPLSSPPSTPGEQDGGHYA